MEEPAREHAGLMLKEQLEKRGITPYRLAKDINVTQTHISEILRGKRRISAAMALKLGKYFGHMAEFWLRHQSAIDLKKARERIGDELGKIVPYSK